MSDPSEGYAHEPVRGLPGRLPPGERILWQGSPDWRRLALTAFHLRAVAVYFALILAWAVGAGAGPAGIVGTLVAAVLALGILGLLAWATARASVYTLTDRRLVLRIGVALPTCINVPLAIVGTAAVQRHRDGTGDLALALKGRERMGYALLWPHARPWRLSAPQPMLRAVPEIDRVAALVARQLAQAVPGGRRLAVDEPASEAAAVGGKAVAA